MLTFEQRGYTIHHSYLSNICIMNIIDSTCHPIHQVSVWKFGALILQHNLAPWLPQVFETLIPKHIQASDHPITWLTLQHAAYCSTSTTEDPLFREETKAAIDLKLNGPNLFELIFSAVARITAGLASNTSNTTPPTNISKETRKWPSHQKQQQLVKFMKLNMAANQAPVMHEASIGRVCRQNVNHSKNGSLSLNIG